MAIEPGVRRFVVMGAGEVGRRAQELAAKHPNFDIIHGDVTDPAELGAQGVGNAPPSSR